MKKLLSVVLALATLSSAAVFSAELIDLARADIRNGRMGLVVTAMDLTPEQQEKFWPIYREYADEQDQLLEQRINTLTRFVANYDQLDAESAKEIAESSIAFQRARADRRERYFKRVSEVLGPVLAARFIQVDSQISTLLDFELMRNTPLILPPVPAAEGAEKGSE